MLNLSSLNPQQRLAVETIHGPVLILAGAGTGKTRVITHRIAYLLSKGINPSQVLAVTFTNKAAREMKSRVSELVRTSSRRGEEKPETPTVCTFHSLCVRILRRHIEQLGYKRNFVIYSESEQLGAIKKVLSHISDRAEKVDAKLVLSFLSRLKNGSDTSADDKESAVARHIQPRYESALKACNAVDFDDLILLTLRLFQEYPDALESCRAKYRYVMVDEYQDTNGSQFDLVHALTKEHRNFCVVGDDDQSIYGWRGAEVANLLELEKHYPEVKVIKLEQNYRSTNTILKAANAVIKFNARRRGKQLWSQKGDGEKITLFALRDDDEEAKTIVEEIEYNRIGKRIPWTDHAILFRTNLQSRPLEMALRQADVRYHLIGGQSYFDRREVKDFLAYLRVFLNPADEISLLRIANVPARGLADETMARLLGASQERKIDVFSVMKNPVVQMTFPTRARESISGFIELFECHRQKLLQSETKLGDWAESFLDEIGYYNELRRSEKDSEAADNRIRNLRELVVSMNESSGGILPMDQLQTFLEDITLDSDRAEEKEKTGDAVTLITMHSCKGLEFPRVFVVGLEDGLLPHTRSKVEGTLDEERRLFYVAITRAQETLAVSHCAGRKKYGQVVPCHPSPFLGELPSDLIELASERGREPVPISSGKDMFANIRAGIG